MSAQEILKANQLHHDREARSYDLDLPYMKNRFAQAMFIGDVDEIVRRSAVSGGALKVLDCGAGTGNLALKFLARGCAVTAVDLSSKMLEQLRGKARAACFDACLQTVCSDIDSFLSQAVERYDVVCSSSFLHHLPDYRVTYRQLCRVCAARGTMYTAFEPLANDQWTTRQKALTAVDRGIHEFIYRRYYRPDVIVRGALRRAGLLRQAESNGYQFNHDLIERPDLGVSEEYLTMVLKQEGFGDVSVRWRSVKRFLLTYWLDLHIVHSCNALFLIARRP